MVEPQRTTTAQPMRADGAFICGGIGLAIGAAIFLADAFVISPGDKTYKWTLFGLLREHPTATFFAIAAIGLGIALGAWGWVQGPCPSCTAPISTLRTSPPMVRGMTCSACQKRLLIRGNDFTTVE